MTLRSAAQQKDVSQVDKSTGRLTDNEDDVTLQDGIDKEQDTPKEAEVPEDVRDQRFLVFLTMNPLEEETHEEHELTDQAYCKGY
jgi:hypothetical protein